MSVQNIPVIPGYKIQTDSQLGKGTFGTVLLGKSVVTESPVAIKTMTIWEKYSVEKAQHEVSSLQSIHASNAVKFRYSFHEGNNFHIIMDKAPGMPLTEPQKLTHADFYSISKQLLEFVVDIRKQNLIHFDLKYRNFLWDKGSKALTVVDFAGVQKMDAPYDENALAYTKDFCAPEFILGMKQVPDYDLWSVASIIHGMFTKKPIVLVNKSLSHNDQLAYVLQQIVHQIGKPTEEFLARCPLADVYFTKNGELKKKWDIPVTHWKDAYSEFPGNEKGYHKPIIELLQQLFRYENRTSPEQLLRETEFAQCTATFRLECDRTKPHKLYLHLASRETRRLEMLSPSDIKNIYVTIDVKTYKPWFVHILKDPHQRYYLFLEFEGSLIKEEMTLKELDTLDIRPLQAALEKPRSAKKSLNFAENEQPNEKRAKEVE